MNTYDDSRAKTTARLFLCRERLKKLQKYVILYKKDMLIVSKALATLKLIADYNSYRGGKH